MVLYRMQRKVVYSLAVFTGEKRVVVATVVVGMRTAGLLL